MNANSPTHGETSAAQEGLVDLAAIRLGGMVLAANDEFFAPKEALLDPSPPQFDPNAYTDRGKLMDGWETRRRRTPGSDWCVIRLGVCGLLRRLIVDTSYFRGNYPEACSVDQALVADPTQLPAESDWQPLLHRSPLSGDTENVFDVESATAATHLRLWIHPDGGVARFRAMGQVVPDLRQNATRGGLLDLAALVNGAVVEEASGEFFSPRHNLIMVGDARDMGDGWETRRRRGAGNDWVSVRLATIGCMDRVEIDSTHFKGNSPAAFSLEARNAADDPAAWWEVIPRTRLAPHLRHGFRVDSEREASHVRLSIFPDGGIARLRVWGRVTDEGWQTAGLRWFNALPDADAIAALHQCCSSSAWATQVNAGRPYQHMDALHAAAEQVWWGLDEQDWTEAFAAHPRIGDRSGPEHTLREQSGTQTASPHVLQALANGNERYEERFGRVFLIFASGRTAEEMLAALTERLSQDPATELRTAAGEQAKITRLRLERMMRPVGLDP